MKEKFPACGQRGHNGIGNLRALLRLRQFSIGQNGNDFTAHVGIRLACRVRFNFDFWLHWLCRFHRGL